MRTVITQLEILSELPITLNGTTETWYNVKIHNSVGEIYVTGPIQLCTIQRTKETHNPIFIDSRPKPTDPSISSLVTKMLGLNIGTKQRDPLLEIIA